MTHTFQVTIERSSIAHYLNCVNSQFAFKNKKIKNTILPFLAHISDYTGYIIKLINLTKLLGKKKAEEERRSLGKYLYLGVYRSIE